MERSGSGPYAAMAKKLEKSATELFNKPKAGSHPDVIGKVMVKAVKARRPKTRYAKGKMAKTILFLRRILTDRQFDFLIKNYG